MAVKMRPARMSSAEYWRRRESQRRKERIADEKERAKLLQEIYRTAVDQMTREVESFFQRYARDEQITLADARRRVSLLDMKEYERLAKQYVESKDFSPEANRQMKLYNLTMKANRLELLRNRLGLEMVKMTNDTQTEISRALVERSLETFEEYAGILGESVRDPLALAATISQEPFKGAKWSERLWGTNQKGLYDSVTRTLENALISGKNAKQLASSLRKQYGRSLYEAERLMVTEMARCQTEAAKLSMEANENEYYMVLTANAMGPCGDCSDLEDQTTRDPIPVKDMEPGVNAPPLHPSCHCATAPWWDEKKYQEWLDSGAAKEGMTFAEFEAESLLRGQDSNDKIKITGRNVLAQDGEEGTIPPEYVHNYDDYEEISLSKNEMVVLKELRELADMSGNECGIAFFNGKFTEPFSSGENAFVEIPKEYLSVSSVRLYHSHTNDTLLSAKDLQLLLKDNVEMVVVSTRNGDVYAASVGDGYRPTEDEFNEDLMKIRAEADAATMENPNFWEWTPEQRTYMAIREQAYLIARQYGWKLEGGELYAV